MSSVSDSIQTEDAQAPLSAAEFAKRFVTSVHQWMVKAS